MDFFPKVEKKANSKGAKENAPQGFLKTKVKKNTKEEVQKKKGEIFPQKVDVQENRSQHCAKYMEINQEIP